MQESLLKSGQADRLPRFGDRCASLLAQREICRSTPLDVFQSALNGFFYPGGRIETSAFRPAPVDSLLRAGRLNQVTVALVRYGTEAMVDGGELGAYHVNVPISGAVASACGPRETVAIPTRATVFTPHEHSVLPLWSEDASQVWVKIEKSALETEIEALLGRPIAGDVQFERAMDLTTPRARSWLRVLRLILMELDRPGGALERSPTYGNQLERLLISGLVRTQAHDHLGGLCGAFRPARPRTVKRVVDLIEAGPEINYTLSDLARHAGVGARRLEIAFQESLNTSPMGYLRKVRLGRTRADLLAGAEPDMSVAYRWGFNYLGRFAATYRRTYGELPSETVRGKRGVWVFPSPPAVG
ncbi:AraC family transcriptional regulator [Pseudonocardia sp. CA-142604]|uniref:AraC family transcriptional regulator n=1 Tax=Pseudonocardia sp. CA-142604 TaxID=3240024 RepID=UPI003D9001E1